MNRNENVGKQFLNWAESNRTMHKMYTDILVVCHFCTQITKEQVDFWGKISLRNQLTKKMQNKGKSGKPQQNYATDH